MFQIQRYQGSGQLTCRTCTEILKPKYQVRKSSVEFEYFCCEEHLVQAGYVSQENVRVKAAQKLKQTKGTPRVIQLLTSGPLSFEALQQASDFSKSHLLRLIKKLEQEQLIVSIRSHLRSNLHTPEYFALASQETELHQQYRLLIQALRPEYKALFERLADGPRTQQELCGGILSHGVCLTVLRTLTKNGLLITPTKAIKLNRSTVYALPEQANQIKDSLAQASLSSLQRQIIHAIQAQPGLTFNNLCNSLDITHRQANYNVHALAAKDLVVLRRQGSGRQLQCYPVEAGN